MTTKEIEEDFLENDPIIRGQEYVLLSFLSPEKIISEKQVYFFKKFLDKEAPELGIKLEDLNNKYLDFMYSRMDALEEEYYKANNFRSSMRGLKVRGVYDNMSQAKIKAKQLQSRDKNFHVFIGQVGYWLPWDPQADNMDDQEFMNHQLNDMMKQYKDNNVYKDEIYEEMKTAKIDKARKEVLDHEKDKLENTEQEPEPELVNNETSPIFDEDDPWLQHKKRMEEQ